MTAILPILLLLAGWGYNLEEAQAKAKDENKLILLYFSGSDWCGPCIKLKQDILDQSIFLDFASTNLELVKADFPRQKKNRLSETQTLYNEKLAEKYNKTGRFPLTLLLNSKGEVLKEWDGYPKKITVETFTKEIKSFR